MNATPLPAVDVSGAAPVLEPTVDAYLARLAREQARFLDAVAVANATLTSAPLARIAAVHGRLTQEFLDAQRAIVKRRAETESTVVRIDRAAALEIERVIGDAGRPTGTGSAGTAFTTPPTGAPTARTWPAPHGFVDAVPISALDGSAADLVSLARLVDDAFHPADADGAVMKRQLRELLDEWWHLENQEQRATIDDAHARAAMAIHGAHVEAAHASAVASELIVPTAAREPARQLPPIVAAIDATCHEDLDALLASLLDDLDAPAHEALDSGGQDLPAPSPGSVPAVTTLPTLPTAADSLTDTSAAPQEAFDRFWGTFVSRRSTRREWIFVQVLFPAVAVVAVLALVLAVVG